MIQYKWFIRVSLVTPEGDHIMAPSTPMLCPTCGAETNLSTIRPAPDGMVYRHYICKGGETHKFSTYEMHSEHMRLLQQQRELVGMFVTVAQDLIAISKEGGKV